MAPLDFINEPDVNEGDHVVVIDCSTSQVHFFKAEKTYGSIVALYDEMNKKHADDDMYLKDSQCIWYASKEIDIQDHRPHLE